MDGKGPQGKPEAAEAIRSVRRLASLAAERRASVLEPHGLDDGRLDVLEALEASSPAGRLTAGELALRCRVTAGAVSQRLSAMEKTGLVERIREQPDRRTVHVRLTATGRAALAEVAGQVAAAEQSLLDGLTETERTSLASALARWLQLHEIGASSRASS